MKILVMSDTHGNTARVRHLVGFAKKVGLEAIVHCGDWGTPECVLAMREAGIPIYAVLGNADEAQQEAIEKAMKELEVFYSPETLEAKLSNTLALIAHQPGLVEASIQSGQYDVVFHGHTHQRKDKFIGKTHVINPGAVHNTTTPSFAVYDTESDKVEFLDIAL